MSWISHIDWAAVVAAIIALINAFNHKALATQVQANHTETLAAIKGPVG